MKKTNYTIMVSFNYSTFKETYRRVWIDENGKYFIKYNGEVLNVTDRKKDFIKD